MKMPGSFLIAIAALAILPACEQKSNVNRTDGVKDALNTRPNESIRDAGEDIGRAAKEAGHDVKEGLKEAGHDLKNAVNGQ